MTSEVRKMEIGPIISEFEKATGLRQDMGVHNSNEEDYGRNICHIFYWVGVNTKFTTWHINDTRDLLRRLRVQVYMSFDLPNVTVLSILTADNLNVTSLTTASHYMKTDQIRIYKKSNEVKTCNIH